MVDSTAMATFANPVFAIIEKIAGMSNAVSRNARIFGTVLGYLGIVSIVPRGRYFSRKIFKIADQTSEFKQWIHDSLYLAIFHLLWQPIFYLISGSRDAGEIGWGTLDAVAYGLFAGWPVGYIMDVFEDLFGLRKCERKSYPNFVRKQSSAVKKNNSYGVIHRFVCDDGCYIFLFPVGTKLPSIGNSNPLIPKENV